MSLEITFYNLSVKIHTVDIALQRHIRSFLEKYYTVVPMGNGGPNRQPNADKIFASEIKNRGIWFLHNNQFIHFYHYLKEINYDLKDVTTSNCKEYDTPSTEIAIREGWNLRERQIPAAEFLLNNPVKSKLLPLVMGAGKTLVASYCLSKIQKKFGVVILSRFVDKWLSDIQEIIDCKIEDILVIRGSKHLSALIKQSKEGVLPTKFFIFGSETLQAYISSYQENPEVTVDIYGCAPIDLFPLLGINTMLNDESHMSFHSLFKIIIHTNVKFHLGLSATMISEEAVVRRVHKVVYPLDCIYGDDMLEKYIDVYPTVYYMPESAKRFVKTTSFGSTNYSHTAFEKSIMKRRDLTDRYTKIICASVDDYYINDYKDKDKCIIFVATINFANHLVKAIAEKYTSKVVKRYCEDDPYEDLMAGEIVVTTIMSAGTGVDIPALRTAVQTVSVSSPASNLQSMGRLRELKDRDVKFCYLYCDNLNKQKAYHMRRLELFRPRVASINLRKSRVNF